MAMLESGDDGGRERRKHLRVRISVKAQLEARPRAPVPCDIYNVSVGGALLACNLSLYLGQPVVLHMEGFLGPSGPYRPCYIDRAGLGVRGS